MAYFLSPLPLPLPLHFDSIKCRAWLLILLLAGHEVIKVVGARPEVIIATARAGKHLRSHQQKIQNRLFDGSSTQPMSDANCSDSGRWSWSAWSAWWNAAPRCTPADLCIFDESLFNGEWKCRLRTEYYSDAYLEEAFVLQSSTIIKDALELTASKKYSQGRLMEALRRMEEFLGIQASEKPRFQAISKAFSESTMVAFHANLSRFPNMTGHLFNVSAISEDKRTVDPKSFVLSALGDALDPEVMNKMGFDLNACMKDLRAIAARYTPKAPGKHKMSLTQEDKQAATRACFAKSSHIKKIKKIAAEEDYGGGRDDKEMEDIMAALDQGRQLQAQSFLKKAKAFNVTIPRASTAVESSLLLLDDKQSATMLASVSDDVLPLPVLIALFGLICTVIIVAALIVFGLYLLLKRLVVLVIKLFLFVTMVTFNAFGTLMCSFGPTRQWIRNWSPGIKEFCTTYVDVEWSSIPNRTHNSQQHA